MNNISKLADDLTLGLDSFMFFDDDPINIVSVSSMIPQVLAVRWPEQPTAQANVLKHLWALDVAAGAGDVNDDATTASAASASGVGVAPGGGVDAKRTEMYRENLARQAFKESNSSLTFLDFISSLEIKTEFESHTHGGGGGAVTEALARVAQMTRRTNRYNLCKRMLSDGELMDWLLAGGKGEGSGSTRDAFTVVMTDRFGDYGIVGAALTEVRTQAQGPGGAPKRTKTLEVSQFLMSCRVLNRGVEHTLLRKLGEKAHEEGCGEVSFAWMSTAGPILYYSRHTY